MSNNNPRVTFLTIKPGQSFIIVSTASHNEAYIISIDPIYNTLYFSGIPGIDVFPTHKQAINFITNNQTVTEVVEAQYIFGYLFSLKSTYLFLVKESQVIFKAFDQHQFMSIFSFETVRINTKIPINNYMPEEKILQFPFNKTHFFSPTIDSSHFIFKNKTCWNSQLKKPFDNLQIPNVCISLFQGTPYFKTFPSLSISLLLIGYHNFPTKHDEHELNETLSTSNESQIDIFVLRDDHKCHVLQHTFLLGDFPFTYKTNVKPTNVPNGYSKYTNDYIQQIITNYEIEEIIFLNLLPSKQTSNDIIYHTLCDLIPHSKSTKLIQINWENSYQTEQIIESFYGSIASDMNSYGYNQYTYEENIKLKKKQKGIFRFTFGTKFENEIILTFLYLLRIVLKLINNDTDIRSVNDIEKIPEEVIQNVLIFYSYYLHNFSDFSTIKINDKYIRKLFTILHKRTFHVNTTPVNNVLELITSLISIKYNLFYSVSQSIKSFIISNNINKEILNPNSQKQFVLNGNSNQIIIFLSEVSFLREIIFDNVYAISVNIYGGLWLNRMFPIIENVSIPQTTDDKNMLHLEFDTTNNNFYRPNFDVFSYEPIRFISFSFVPFHKEQISLSGIYIYGTSTTTNKIQKSISFKYSNQIEPSLIQYNEEYSIENLFKWEYKRLLNNGSFFDLEKTMIMRNLPPNCVNINNIFLIRSNEILSKKCVCEKCKVKSHCFNCVICSKYFCLNCFSNNKRICKNCDIQMKSNLEKLSNLLTLKSQIIDEKYPFIKKHLENIDFYMKRNNNFSNICNFPNMFLMYELPIGKNNVLPEKIFLNDNHLIKYKVDVTILKFSIILEYETEISQFIIFCDFPLKIEIDGISTFSIEPPGKAVNLNFNGRIIPMKIFGKKISIKSIQFKGQYIISNTNILTNSITNVYSVPKPFRGELLQSSSYTSAFNGELQCHSYVFNERQELIGIKFPKRYTSYLIIEFNDNKDFCKIAVPKMESLKPVMIYFKETKRVKTLKIYYTNLKKWFPKHLPLSDTPIPIVEIRNTNKKSTKS